MTVPRNKNQGCFQCSKRRIVCDGLEPTCKKCQKKGIECSGLGRFRFSDGLARRGKLKGCTIPVARAAPEMTFQEQRPNVVTPGKIRWKNEQPMRAKRKAVKRADSSNSITNQPNPGRPSDVVQKDRLGFVDTVANAQWMWHNGREYLCDDTSYSSEGITSIMGGTGAGLHEQFDELDGGVVNCVYHKAPVQASAGSISPWIPPLSPRVRMLFSYFAHEVAPVMVVLDNISNGYRDVILPMACEDEVLQCAISVVATQHLAGRQPNLEAAAESDRAALISRLRRDSLQTSSDRVFNISNWATLIILLVGETITGSPGYSHLLHTLMCLTQNISQVGHMSVNSFLMQQTHMFQFLGQPLLGEPQGIHVLRLPIDRYLDWTFYDLPPESKHNHFLHLSRLAFIKASQIYLGRATTNQNQWQLLESVKQLVTQVDPDEAGSHALVWVCFIAAADSSDTEHRRFFTDRMNWVFAKTRFRNILAAIELLSAIWSQQGSGRWTEELIRLSPSLIM